MTPFNESRDQLTLRMAISRITTMRVCYAPTIGPKRSIKQNQERSKLLSTKFETLYLKKLPKTGEIPDVVPLLRLNDLQALLSPSPSIRTHKNPLKTSSFPTTISQYDLRFKEADEGLVRGVYVL